ncbi:helix-turn-helix transcriptional regulator [Fulvivirgaceae bacterium BMA10]|uniref:Helix-turn-helix transcriptional regulator n=1 Tax=Splendidivirga corallicola TaxID=3051826 RepID=A0ABT8KWX9_9BACT|nr:helix-turn-helix transcriptional regulator [Fulvivirgaceae bacterium BMA10]
MSNRETIGLLEEMILLIVLKNQEINGAEVSREYQEAFRKNISLPAIIAVLKRLEKKGLLTSHVGEPKKERGGRRKRLYEATLQGYEVVAEIQKFRNESWKNIPYFDI